MVPLWEDAGSGVQVVRLTEREEVEELVHLFEKVSEAEGWQPPEGALQAEMRRSLYFALNNEEQLAGGLQLVLPDEAGALSCQSVWPEVMPSPHSAHIAILAFDEAFRGQQRYFWHVACEMWRECVGKGVTTLFIEVTPRVLPIYQRLGWPLQIVGELREHWGEGCYLASLGIPEVAEALLRRAEHSEYYRQIIAQAFRVTMSPRMGRERVSATSAVG